MTNGGEVRIYVSDLQRAVEFYTETIGLRLRAGYQDQRASIDAGNVIRALHSMSGAGSLSAGKSGSISVGFEVIKPLEGVIARLEGATCSFAAPSRKTLGPGSDWRSLTTRTGTICISPRRALPGEQPATSARTTWVFTPSRMGGSCAVEREGCLSETAAC
jgi:catechol 2,3-dioxygenase-like lactoylglutathione lyase family enzyme